MRLNRRAPAVIATALCMLISFGAATAQAESRISLPKVKREARELLRGQCGGPDRCVSKRLLGCERTSRTRARCRAVYVFNSFEDQIRADVVTRWKTDGRRVEATNIDSDFETL